MSHIEKDDPNLEKQDQADLEPAPVMNEEFEKKQKKENEIIETVLDGIFTFFR